MFSLFSKNSGPDVTDRAWMSTAAMNTGIAQWLDQNSNGLVATWFAGDRTALLHALPESAASRVFTTGDLTAESLTGKQLLVAGHYPLLSGEAAFAEKTGLKKLLIYSALDSPLFKRFGGDKLIDLARGMGMKEDEGIEHFLLGSAIKKTQGKITDQVTTETPADSEAAWMQINLQGA